MLNCFSFASNMNGLNENIVYHISTLNCLKSIVLVSAEIILRYITNISAL